MFGARGSIPSPGAATARYGGNTPCVAVQGTGDHEDRLVILDAGTGIRLLGQQLTEQANGAVNVDLIVSHTHWDHIQGLPFFAPAFGLGNAVRIWGARQGDVALDVILRQLMSPVVFPIPLDALSAEISVRHVEGDAFEVDGFLVRAIRLRHPGTTLGYRLTPVDGGGHLAYVTDNELGAGGDYDVGPSWREEMVKFVAGADALIHDAMFTPEELDRHRGWGHSSYLEAVTLAVEAGVKHLVLFHHRPERDDAGMDVLLARARDAAARQRGTLEVSAAQEGNVLTL